MVFIQLFISTLKIQSLVTIVVGIYVLIFICLQYQRKARLYLVMHLT